MCRVPMFFGERHEVNRIPVLMEYDLSAGALTERHCFRLDLL